MYSNQDLIYITKETVLSYLTQEQIFCEVFNIDEIVEYRFLTSPFRDDRNPGCWFEYDNNILKFRDFGSGYNKPIDCFDAVKIKYNLKDFKEVLHFIMSNQFNTQGNVPLPKVIKFQKEKAQIDIVSRCFYDYDVEYWGKYGISIENLNEDKVIPVNKIYYKREDLVKTKDVFTLCYAYTDFKSGNKKLYFPYQRDKFRFITNCTKNDIGNFDNIHWFNSKLIITKSYKDCRVLRNLGINSVWFQNEGSKPDDEILFSLINGFDDIIIWYDNDQAGINAATALITYLTAQKFNARMVYLPQSFLEKNIKDPSDLIVHDKSYLIQFLKTNLLYETT